MRQDANHAAAMGVAAASTPPSRLELHHLGGGGGGGEEEHRREVTTNLQRNIVGKLKKHLSGEALHRQVQLHTDLGHQYGDNDEVSTELGRTHRVDIHREMMRTTASSSSSSSMAMTARLASSSFDEVDQNHDGVIDRHEWQQASFGQGDVSGLGISVNPCFASK